MLRAAVAFSIGYVLGARAGRERYAQIEEIAKKVGRQATGRGESLATPAHRG